MPTEHAAALAQARGRLGVFGREVYFYEDVRSTNDLAGTLAERGAAEGTVVIADRQTAGRGRLGRTWCSPPGAGLYVSIVLRPHPHAVPLVTIAAGVAIVEGIRAATGLAVALKWPNDVMVVGASTRSAAKLAGILTEASHVAAGQPCLVVGFGINLLPAAYPPEIAARATSIEGELGRPVDRGLVLAECMAALAARYDELHGVRAAEVLAAWRSHARPLLGRAVEWDERGAVCRGVAEDVDDRGALMVRTARGVVRVISGEVRWT